MPWPRAQGATNALVTVPAIACASLLRGERDNCAEPQIMPSSRPTTRRRSGTSSTPFQKFSIAWRCGGFSQGRRIAQAAFELGRECVPHAFSTGILIAASLQMVAAMPRGTYCEYTVAESHDALDVLASGFEFADGYVRVPMGPGLGIEIDEDKLARHRVA